MKQKADLIRRWVTLTIVGAVMYVVLTSFAHAMCTMTTVIDTNTGMVKMCTQCCEGGMCTVTCN